MVCSVLLMVCEFILFRRIPCSLLRDEGERTLRGLGECGSGSGFREFRKITPQLAAGNFIEGRGDWIL